jgi:hypothetical protein
MLALVEIRLEFFDEIIKWRISVERFIVDGR